MSSGWKIFTTDEDSCTMARCWWSNFMRLPDAQRRASDYRRMIWELPGICEPKTSKPTIRTANSICLLPSAQKLLSTTYISSRRNPILLLGHTNPGCRL